MNMKKTALAASMLLSLGAASTGAQALSINVTTMEFYDAGGNPGFYGGGLNTSVVGSMNSAATGVITSGGTDFFGTPWTATQQMWTDTVRYSNWSGSSASGPFNYDFWLTGNQVAVGMYFNWGAAVDIAVLQIFDCDGTTCANVNNDSIHPTVPGTVMDNGPFAGQHATFKGLSADTMPAVQAVPVPAAVWLFGSGLLGLVGVARRKKQA